jgi:hypothetical protein
MDKIDCLLCDYGLKRVYVDGGVELVCKIDHRPMRDYRHRLAECNGFREVPKESKDAKDKGSRKTS